MMKTQSMIRTVILLSGLLVVSSCQKNYRVVEPDFDRSMTDELVEARDDVARAAQLPVLRELDLDDAVHEVRIWVGFGPNVLQHFYSIDLTQGVNGRLIRHFKRLNNWDEDEYREFVDSIYDCQPLGQYELVETCVDQEYVFDWAAVYQDLLKLDFWNLPDESELPRYRPNDDLVYTDGMSVVVELKKPGFYRSFRYRYETRVVKDKYLYGNKILNIIEDHSKSVYESDSGDG
jgi:hypothetical protein